MKRVNLFLGHYGSGKTNVALNFAFDLKEKGLNVSIADLDIVNPYFRTKDSEKELEQAGIELVALPFAGTNVDLPSLPAETYGLVMRNDKHVILDIGGDDRGAYALGRFTPYILEENNFDMFFVVNFYRPLTRNAEEAMEVFYEIQQAAKMQFTGIINNSNLGEETTAEDVERTIPLAESLAEKLNLPVVMTTVSEKIFEDVDCDNKFMLKLQKKYY
ncbi:MAG: hypothetical protein MJ120_02180 [Clostridia bacterium]|nr:hypothetical protein [Clostridia bacterium]